jgi:hypothetical protein
MIISKQTHLFRQVQYGASCNHAPVRDFDLTIKKCNFLKKIGASILFSILFFLSATSFAQDTVPRVKPDDSDIQQLLENVAENSNNENADYTTLLDAMNYYQEHPINLNNTTRQELEQLVFLNDLQINALINHIDKYGKLITIYELQGINGFDLQTIRKILPYVRVTDNFNSANFNIKEMFKNGQSMVMMRYGRVIEQQKGFAPIDSAGIYKSPNSRYIGSPDKIYARYRFTYGTNISWGITADKDQGELLFKNQQNFKYDWYNQSLNGKQGNGFDFYSAHFYMHNVKFIKSLAIGDYQVTFGQGLTAWTSFAFSKSANIMGVKKSAMGIRPYTSVDENKFLRGAAGTIALSKHIEVTGFVSRKHIDANITDTLADGETAAISSLQTTGYHTTPAELVDKHAILQTIYGGHIGYTGRKFDVGLTALNYQLASEFNRSLTYYSQFEFSGQQNSNIGFDYNYIFRNFNFFGEESRSQNGGMAYLNGALISLDPRLSLTILHRNYQRNFQNLIGSGFAENSTPQNEKGLYFGVMAQPTTTTMFTAYYDRFEFPWMGYQINAPSHGTDYVAQFNYTPSKKVDMYFRIRERDKQKNTNDASAVIYGLVPMNQTNYRFNIAYSILPTIKLKNRIELIDYKLGDNKTEKGYSAYQDITYNKVGKPLSVTLRYELFQTDSYNSRIYAYESDMPGVYSILADYYRGSRFYVMLDYNLTRKIEIWFRYSQTFYDNQSVISQGSDFRIQVKFKF